MGGYYPPMDSDKYMHFGVSKCALRFYPAGGTSGWPW